jgi:hypothetical protein
MSPRIKKRASYRIADVSRTLHQITIERIMAILGQHRGIAISPADVSPEQLKAWRRTFVIRV